MSLGHPVPVGPAPPRVRSFQVFDDMQRELVLMTTPKHKNVLMVHGMYSLGSLGPRWSGPPTAPRALACARACAAPRRKRTCCW